MEGRTKGNKFKKLIVGVLVLTLLAGAAIMYPQKSRAAILTNFTATPNTFAGSATDITFTWTASAAIETTGTTFTFTVSPALPNALANCTAADTQADTTSGGAGSFGSFSTTNATFTTTNATTTTGRSLCIKFPALSSSTTYSVNVLSSATNTNDSGATLVYGLSDNIVNVTGTVNASLSFNIRALDDLSDTNVCDLGTVTTTTTTPNADAIDDGAGECGYSLAIGTNAASGFQAQIASDGKFRSGSVNIVDITDNNPFDNGTEGYGIANVTGAATGRNNSTGLYDQSVTENTTASFTFQTDSSPVPQSASNFVSYSGGIQYTAGTDAADVTKVVHGFTVGSGTPAGNYAQAVTYTVTATF